MTPPRCSCFAKNRLNAFCFLPVSNKQRWHVVRAAPIFWLRLHLWPCHIICSSVAQTRPCISQQVKWLKEREKPLLHLSSLFCFACVPHPSYPSAFFPLPDVSVFLHPFQYAVHSDVSLELLPLDTSEGPCEGNDRTCIPLFFSFCLALSFALLRMADYLSLHGLSGADRRLSWRGRQRASQREDPVSPRALTSLTTMPSAQMHSRPSPRSPQVV